MTFLRSWGGRDLPVTMLMHASLTASTMIFQPLDRAGIPLLIYTVASAAAKGQSASSDIIIGHSRHVEAVVLMTNCGREEE